MDFCVYGGETNYPPTRMKYCLMEILSVLQVPVLATDLFVRDRDRAKVFVGAGIHNPEAAGRKLSYMFTSQAETSSNIRPECILSSTVITTVKYTVLLFLEWLCLTFHSHVQVNEDS